MSKDLLASTSGDLHYFGEWITSESARSLELLRKIESTVLALRTIRDLMQSFDRTVSAFNEALPNMSALPQEDVVLEEFARAQDALEQLHGVMSQKRVHARKDKDLRSDDPVCPAFDETIESIHQVHEGIEHLRWNIMQHAADADTSDPGKVLTSEQQIRDFLSTL